MSNSIQDFNFVCGSIVETIDLLQTSPVFVKGHHQLIYCINISYEQSHTHHFKFTEFHTESPFDQI